MDKIVPLPSPYVKGRLGVAGLPRLWLAGILAAAGLLPDGYARADEAGNRHVLERIGLDPVATAGYLARVPHYTPFEDWVRANARALDATSVAAGNAAVDTPAAVLEALEDWARVRADVVARRGTALDTIVPAVSMQARGPLGLMHLPRLWMKATLRACGALYDGWRSGPESGFDVWFSGAVGLDLEATIAHIHAELPIYPAFEQWAAAHAKRVSSADAVELNTEMWQRVKPPALAESERALVGIDDPSYKPSIELNDLVDWFTLHEIVVRSEHTNASTV